MSTPTTRRARGNRQTLIIGFDFGTHSTKVVVRERGKDVGIIVSFDKPAEGYPRCASPSLVRCVDNRLYFGTEALNSLGGELFPRLKVDLLRGHSNVNSATIPGLNGEVLIAAYCAWALQQLQQALPECSAENVFLNVGAPMNHFGDSELRTRYLRIIQAAWRLTFGEFRTPVGQGIPVRVVLNKLQWMLSDVVIGQEQRKFEVLPEAIAPVISLSLDPLMKSGMYMIADTGAATTEMSVFHVGDTGSDGKRMVLCYHAMTEIVGGIDLHTADGSKLNDIAQFGDNR